MGSVTDWKQLERDVTTWLKGFARPDLTYRGPNQAIPGFPSHGFRSDGLLTDDRVIVAVEIEAGQTHPDTNVGKYWLLAKTEPHKRIILFHVYTPAYDSYGWRKRLGDFYADMMIEQGAVEYNQLDRRSCSDYQALLAEIRNVVGRCVRREFPGMAAPS